MLSFAGPVRSDHSPTRNLEFSRALTVIRRAIPLTIDTRRVHSGIKMLCEEGAPVAAVDHDSHIAHITAVVGTGLDERISNCARG